jgi:hypothetical protein
MGPDRSGIHFRARMIASPRSPGAWAFATIDPNEAQRVRSWPFLVVLAALCAAPSARADDADARALARRYAEEGIAFHDSGNELAAVKSFTRAYEVVGAPTVGIRLARSLANLGRLIEAEKVYRAVIATRVKKDDPPVFNQAVTDAGAELARLTPRIPTLELTLSPGVTSPLLDTAPVALDTIGRPFPVDPGPHRISGVGATPEVPTLHEGDHLKLLLRASASAATPVPAAPVPSPPSTLNWRRIAGISGLGLAGASLVVGVVGSAQANAVGNDPAFKAYRTSTVTSNVCVSAAFGGDHPDAAITALCGKAARSELLQAIFYPAFAVFGGAGAYLLLTSGKATSAPPAQAHFTPYVGPGAAGLDITGTF